MRENVQILHETRGFATSEWTCSAWAVCRILLDIIDLLEKCGIPKTQHVASGAFLRGLQSIGDFHNLLHASYLAFFCYQKTSSRKTMVVVRWYISKRKKKKKTFTTNYVCEKHLSPIGCMFSWILSNVHGRKRKQTIQLIAFDLAAFPQKGLLSFIQTTRLPPLTKCFYKCTTLQLTGSWQWWDWKLNENR